MVSRKNIWSNFDEQPRGLGNHMGSAGRALENSLGLSSWRQTLRKSEAASGLTPDRCSTASFSACADGWPMEPCCRKNWGTRQHNPSHLSNTGGWVTGCLADVRPYGEPWWNSAKSWAAWAGNGRRQTGPWAMGTFWGDLIGPNPTDRGKAGSKRSLGCGPIRQGGPLSIVVAGANQPTTPRCWMRHLEAIVVERPQLTEDDPQHLCLDKVV